VAFWMIFVWQVVRPGLFAGFFGLLPFGRHL